MIILTIDLFLHQLFFFFFFLICFYLTEKINKGTQINHVIEYVENFYMGSRFNYNWNKSTKILQNFFDKRRREYEFTHMLHNIYTRVYLSTNIYIEYRWEDFTLNNFKNTNPTDSSQFPPKLVK